MTLLKQCLAVGALVITMAACSDKESVSTEGVQLPNPAAAHCVAQGGKSVILKEENGEYGVCQFDDDRQCEEWALYRENRCVAPAATHVTTPQSSGNSNTQ